MQHWTTQQPIAYFCAEFGLLSNLPIYAGGLGVLAGDTLKSAADAQLPMVGVGLLYRGERSIQRIDETGMQIDEDMAFDPVEAGLEHVYLDDQPLFIRVHLTEIDIWVRVWKKTISDTVVLYLLDSDTDQNQLSERGITHGLYTGTEDVQLKQQLILGIGGVKLLTALGLHPTIYHLNEGRPAFLYWQLIREYMDLHGGDFREAAVMARQKLVYTNHTLVAAGNNTVSRALLTRYAQYYADKMKISVDELLAPGNGEAPDRFYMTTFALNISRKASGVSALHSELSQQIWPQYKWTNVTNGVHLPTWQSPLLRDADQLSDEAIWQAHLTEKQNLAEFIKQRTGFTIDPNRMIISWARRLAGYKRFDALFADLERLRTVLRNENKPVQLLLSGKAHLLDSAGKQLLQQIIHHLSKELSGYALFIPNYDLDVANHLVKGSDVWLNLPEYGKEACGTSGMKAISNGVLQCTVPDGWAHEVDWSDIGWTLDSNRVSEDLYEQLESKIIPLYYDHSETGFSSAWLQRMRKSITLAQQFGGQRMIEEYQRKLYSVT